MTLMESMAITTKELELLTNSLAEKAAQVPQLEPLMREVQSLQASQRSCQGLLLRSLVSHIELRWPCREF